jgi:hypothetical protein
MQHAPRQVLWVGPPRHGSSVCLSSEPRGARRGTAPRLTAQLPVVDRVRLAEALELSLGQFDVPGPDADGAERDVQARRDDPEREALLAPQPPGLFPLHWSHERMFASASDAENYTHGPAPPWCSG